jgi:WD40 repeat protein
MAFSPDGKLVVTESFDSTARLWDATNGKPIGPPLWYGDDVCSVDFSPDGKTLVTGRRAFHFAKEARFWEVPAPVPGEAERIALWAWSWRRGTRPG